MSLEARTQALLDLVEDDRRARCAAIAREAEAQAAAQVAQARAQARAQVRLAYAELRERAAATLAAAEADLQTRQRLHEQRRVEALLALAWARLPDALRARWADAGTRTAWALHALALARTRLPGGRWSVTHAPDWPAPERAALAEAWRADTGVELDFAADARIAAGLRVAAAGNVVDATLAGLLADRDEIGGRLIGALEEAA